MAEPGIPVVKDTVKQTIVSNLEAPRLRGVSTQHFTTFLKERELYEKQLEEKNKDPGFKVSPTSYRASIDDEDLKIFITANWISASSVDEITEEELQKCVHSRAVREISENQLSLINLVVRDVKMNMNILEAEDRVWSLHRHYNCVLKNAGFADLIEKKPHIAIGHILKRVKPVELQSRMHEIIKWRRDDNFDRKDFGEFMRELAKQAKRLEDEQISSFKLEKWQDGCSLRDTENLKGDNNEFTKHRKVKSQKNFRLVRDPVLA